MSDGAQLLCLEGTELTGRCLGYTGRASTSPPGNARVLPRFAVPYSCRRATGIVDSPCLPPDTTSHDGSWRQNAAPRSHPICDYGARPSATMDRTDGALGALLARRGELWSCVTRESAPSLEQRCAGQVPASRRFAPSRRSTVRWRRFGCVRVLPVRGRELPN
jgi:hypothetical protein